MLEWVSARSAFSSSARAMASGAGICRTTLTVLAVRPFQVLPPDAGFDWGGSAFQQKRSSGSSGPKPSIRTGR